MSDPTAIGGSAAPPARTPSGRYKRKLSNYLLDKKLQLRYVLVVTILSGIIAGALGSMIYSQNREASESIESDTKELKEKIRKDLEHQLDDAQKQLPNAGAAQRDQLANQITELKKQLERTNALDDIPENQHSEDRTLVIRMIIIGLSLVIVLSLYLVVMTHKVAGPLFKVSMYYDRMADGRLGIVTPLRKGDMLQEFFGEFKDMHEAVRARSTADVEQMEAALGKLRDAQNKGDYRGEGRQKLVEELESLEKHLAARRKNLS